MLSPLFAVCRTYTKKWRDVGPVAKELRDEIWNRFKEASAIINKKYQAFFEERKERERENEEKKTSICERVEKIDITSLANHSSWEQATKEILAAQEEWKKLGFASKKVNNALLPVSVRPAMTSLPQRRLFPTGAGYAHIQS